MAKNHIRGVDGHALCGLKTRSGDLRGFGYGTRDVNNVSLVDVPFPAVLGSVKSLCLKCEREYKRVNDVV